MRTMSTDKVRSATRIAVYLVGIRGDSVLLAKRHNVFHMNGYWSLIAGHVYEREPSSAAIRREALEECGLELGSEECKLVGVMHHNSAPFDYVNFIYKVDLTNKTFYNREPYQCEELKLHPLAQLPTPMEEYIRHIIHTSCSQPSPWIAEYGW
jgi:8-oxo-dGTP pyrophosphatase MutT (NUDIX family)